MTKIDKRHVKALKEELVKTERTNKLVKEAIIKRHKITRYIEDLKIAKSYGLTIEEIS